MEIAYEAYCRSFASVQYLCVYLSCHKSNLFSGQSDSLSGKELRPASVDAAQIQGK